MSPSGGVCSHLVLIMTTALLRGQLGILGIGQANLGIGHIRITRGMVSRIVARGGAKASTTVGTMTRTLVRAMPMGLACVG